MVKIEMSFFSRSDPRFFMDVFSRLGFGQGRVQSSALLLTRVLSRARACPAVLLHLCAIPGGTGLVSTAVKLIPAIKERSPLVLAGLSPGKPQWVPWWMPCSPGWGPGRQLPSPSALPTQEISFISFQKQEMCSSICLVFNKVLELP